MLDAYSFDRDQAGLDASYLEMVDAYKRLYARCGLTAVMVEADSGAIGGKESHEFMLPADSGEDTIIICPQCGYAANAEKAVFDKTAGHERPSASAVPLPLEEVATPGMKTIEEVAAFLKVAPSQTLKAVFYMADGQFLFVVIRGDLPVNEIKLSSLLKVKDLRMASEAEVVQRGITPGSASPIGITGVKVVADDSVASGGNYVAGGNKPDVHVRNANFRRDFSADVVGDIALSRAGDACARCGTPYKTMRGIEVGHIFKLGTLYSEKLGAYYADEGGAPRPIVMGCYGIGLGRLLGAAVEQNHDEKGIVWPMPIAPYHVQLCPLYRDGTRVAEVAEDLYTKLQTAGVEVLLDDRQESPGVKFNDADLLGIPIRVTVSPRTLSQNGVEVKRRTEAKTEVLALDLIVTRVKQIIEAQTGPARLDRAAGL